MWLIIRCRRRRRAKAAVKYLKVDDSSVSTITQPSVHSQCSWCYISETGMCKWCSSGEEEDIVDNGENEWRWSGGNLFIDAKQTGWRSVINLPDISPGGNLKREGSVSPNGSFRQGSRSPGAVTRGARATLANPTTTITTTTPKGNLRGDGIHQVQRPRNVPEPPGKAKVRPWRVNTPEY